MIKKLWHPVKSSLFARLMLWTAALLIITIGLIVFFFQRQEVRTIGERSRREGVLLARNIANLNL